MLIDEELRDGNCFLKLFKPAACSNIFDKIYQI